MRKMKWIILTFSLGLLGSCKKSDITSSNLYVPTSSDVTTNATLSELQQGRTLYINNCGVCHGLYSPDDYSASGWKRVMAGMAPRTDMNASQITITTKYLCRGKQ